MSLEMSAAVLVEEEEIQRDLSPILKLLDKTGLRYSSFESEPDLVLIEGRITVSF